MMKNVYTPMHHRQTFNYPKHSHAKLFGSLLTITYGCTKRNSWQVVKETQLGIFEILFQWSYVATLPDLPNWPWPVKESIHLIGGLLDHVC